MAQRHRDLLLPLYAEAAGFQSKALAAATVTQYTAQLRYFVAFCVFFDLPLEEPSEAAVCAYAALLARTLAAASVRQYLKGVRSFYVQRGYSDFADLSAWPKLYRTLKGIDRAKKLGAGKKQPITPAMLMELARVLAPRWNADPKVAATWACALITFFGYFRKSNTTSGPTPSDKCVRVCDISFDAEVYALKVTVRESKTRQVGAAPVIWIAGQQGHVLDPVMAWGNHVRVNRLDNVVAARPAFSFRVGEALLPLGHEVLVQTAKDMAKLVGQDPAQVAGHSFRRGGATFAFQAGVPDILIQRQGDWQSSCYREYVTPSKAQALAATRQMFAAMPMQSSGLGWGPIKAAVEPADHVPGARAACGLEGT